MIAIFDFEDCYIIRIPDLIHTLQICVNNNVFSMKGPETLIGKVKAISAHAAKSDKFCQELEKQVISNFRKNLYIYRIQIEEYRIQ